MFHYQPSHPHNLPQLAKSAAVHENESPPTYITMSAAAEAPPASANEIHHDEPKPETMEYAAQDEKSTPKDEENKSTPRKEKSKIAEAASLCVAVACAPCAFCSLVCMCCLCGDQGTFLDGPFCKDCVPDTLQNFAKRMWKKHKGKE